MQRALVVVLCIMAWGPALAGRLDARLRIADAVSEACVANCASQAESCKRACPVTFGAPCLSACDSQAQTCRSACLPR